MNGQQLRAELGKAKFYNEFKISSLSDKHFKTYVAAIEFVDSDLQSMFHVKPLNEDGEVMPEDFYFLSEKAARKFMDANRDYHTLAWWGAMKRPHHRKYNCMVNLYMVRNAMKGGVE